MGTSRNKRRAFRQRVTPIDRSRAPWSLLAIVALFALLAAACGADSDSADEATDVGFESGGSEESSDDADFASDDEAMEDEEATSAGEASGAPETTAAAAAPETTTVAEPDSDSAADATEEGAAGEEPADGDAESPLGAGGTRVTPTAADIGRKLIFTAFVNVGVDDVAAASAEATSIIEDMGGFLFGQNTTGGSQAQSELTFKVLPADFNQALERLGTVGELRNQSVTTDDVTERIVDLESRIQVADLGVARLRAALEGAATLEDYAEIERLLLDRESDLEIMRGQLRTLEDRVDLATITLVLTQDRVENGIDVRISSYRDHDLGESCPGQEVRSVEADSEVTICFDVTNVGDQTLTNIVLTDSVLEINDETQLLEVFGSLDELAPGQSALVAWEINPERTLRIRTRVSAIPTDGVSSEQAGPSVSTQVEYGISTFEPDTDPGFRDGFSVAVSILQGLWVAIRVTIGFLIPLLILAPFIWLAWRGMQALRRRRPEKPSPTSPAGPGSPPPPAPYQGPGGTPGQYPGGDPGQGPGAGPNPGGGQPVGSGQEKPGPGSLTG